MDTPRVAGSLWNDILGECRDSLDSFIERHLRECGEQSEHSTGNGSLSKEAAVLLADQTSIRAPLHQMVQTRSRRMAVPDVGATELYGAR